MALGNRETVTDFDDTGFLLPFDNLADESQADEVIQLYEKVSYSEWMAKRQQVAELFNITFE